MKRLIRIFTLTLHVTISFMVAFALTFSPYMTPRPPKVAEAGGLGNFAQESTQWLNHALLGESAVQNTITAGATTQSAALDLQNFLRENVLDGIGWTIAKTAVSSIIRSVINWVNSGFQGSPAFITDLRQRLLDVVDEAAGEYIRQLGAIGEFICSPFRLDVQAALSVNYQQARSGMPSGGDDNLCRLSDIGSNIENFLSGTVENMDQWFQVTSNPQNTPTGAYLEAEARLNARLVNAAGQEVQIANWGDGFLSQRVCEAVEGSSGQHCTITTPGRVISEALTFHTSAGTRTLIEADEINELVGALLNQLIVQALQGINGLLGLGGNSNYSSTDANGNSYLDNLLNEAGAGNIELVKGKVDDQLILEQKYLALIYEAILRGETLISESEESEEELPNRTEIEQIILEARTLREKVEGNIETLTEIQTALNDDSTTTDASTARAKAMLDYSTLTQSGDLTTAENIVETYTNWHEYLPELTEPNTEDDLSDNNLNG